MLKRLLVLWLVIGCGQAASVASQDPPNWALRSRNGPTPRYLTEMTYDSARGVTVLYGGLVLPSSLIGDTWEWDGTSWLQRSTNGPSPRAYHALVFDDARDVTVLFGGSGGGFKNDTWEWDGASWDLRSESGPSARYLHAMTYDSDRAVTVLFGGWDGVMLDDTWEWDGVAWVQRGTGGPSVRAAHAMAYDSQRGVVVLFGGVGADVTPEGDPVPYGDTWEWNGSAWSLRATSGPSPRMWHEMCFDSTRGVTILYAGSEDGNGISVFGDTWEWDGTSWTQVATSGPTAKYSFGLAFDSGRARAVLFGGATFGETYSETWEYGSGLTSIPPIPAVSAWGLSVMLLLLLSAGTVVTKRRRKESEAHNGKRPSP